MRILANENFPGPVVRALRELGHDVLWVKEIMCGASDVEVLSRAQAERRILTTFDRDFGELAFRFGLPAECGIIFFRLRGTSPETDNSRTIAALTSRTDWAGHFAVVQDDRIRLRPLPVTGWR
jgi:predicted nuclease of predicted toxin-antitoxin system